MRAISLFSNCGAGDIGYRKAGFRFDVMAEIDPRRLETCLLNHPGAIGIPGDLRHTWTKVVKAYREKAGSQELSLLAACPPCQGMSTARGGRGSTDDPDAGSSDQRNLLVSVIANVALELLPKVIVIENVPQFLIRKVRHPQTNNPISAAALIINLLEKHYKVFPFITDLADYGVPQTRKRSFLTFIKKDDAKIINFLLQNDLIPYPVPSHINDIKHITITDALNEFNLPHISSEEYPDLPAENPLHIVPIWDKDKKRIYNMVKSIPINTGKSAWTNNLCNNCQYINNDEDIYCQSCDELLNKPIIKENGEYRFIKGFRASSYRRMHPNKPASTITTASGHVGSDITIHPFENRLLSPLECAMLQTFPTDFRWGDVQEKYGTEIIRSMIGEAVPPRFTHMHGTVLKSILKNKKSKKILSKQNIRYTNAVSTLNKQFVDIQ